MHYVLKYPLGTGCMYLITSYEKNKRQLIDKHSKINPLSVFFLSENGVLLRLALTGTLRGDDRIVPLSTSEWIIDVLRYALVEVVKLPCYTLMIITIWNADWTNKYWITVLNSKLNWRFDCWNYNVINILLALLKGR